MAQITIDMSGRGGLVERFFGETASSTQAPQNRYIAKDGQIAAGVFNPWAKYGYLTPAVDAYTTLSQSGGSMSNEFRARVYDSATSTLFMGENGPKLWDITISGTTQTLETTITGTSVVINDMEIYQVNGVKKLFTAYQKSTGGDIQINAIPYGTVNATWLSGTVSGAFTMGATNDTFFIPADNGFMYVGDGASLHKIDGTTNGGANGTATANVLTFPVYFTIVDGVDYRGRTWIAVQTSSISGSNNVSANNERICGVYVWDRQTTQVNMTDFIPLPGVREIRRIFLSPKGDLRILCIADTRLVQLRKFNGSYWGSTFDLIAEYPVGSEPTYRKGLDLMGGLTVWLGRNGKFYGYGSLTAGDAEAQYAFGDIASLPSGTFSTGVITAVDASGSTSATNQGVYFSLKDATPTLFTRKWYPNGSGTIDSVNQNMNTTEIFYPVKFLPRMSTIQAIHIACAQGSGSGSTVEGTVKVYVNNSATATLTYSLTRDDIARGYYYINANLPYVNSVQLSVTYPSGQAIATTSFTPAFAVIDYKPTTTSQ